MKSLVLWLGVPLCLFTVGVLWYTTAMFFPRQTLDYSPFFHQRLMACMHLEMDPNSGIPLSRFDDQRIIDFTQDYQSLPELNGEMLIPYLHNTRTSSAALYLATALISEHVDVPLSDNDLKQLIEQHDSLNIATLLDLFHQIGHKIQDEDCITYIFQHCLKNTYLKVDRLPDILSEPEQHLDKFISTLYIDSYSYKIPTLRAFDKMNIFNLDVADAVLDSAVDIVKNNKMYLLATYLRYLEKCPTINQEPLSRLTSIMIEKDKTRWHKKEWKRTLLLFDRVGF